MRRSESSYLSREVFCWFWRGDGELAPDEIEEEGEGHDCGGQRSQCTVVVDFSIESKVNVELQ